MITKDCTTPRMRRYTSLNISIHSKADINISHGGVATHLGCDGILSRLV